ncbi:MAG: exo-alpha-sialidase [Cyclobacteriaceae bacterium]
MNFFHPYILLIGLIALASCQPSSLSETKPKNPVVSINAPATATSGEPNLFVSPEGQLYLSWVAAVDSGHQLRYSVWEDEQWGEAHTIARGENWFVNWADFPSLAVTDTFSAAHWLQKSAEGTYDYNVQVALSHQSQDDWDEAFVLHQDGLAAEHGFVTLLPLSSQEILSVWLDGRHTKEEDGAMNLFANIITPTGTATPGHQLDDRVCDCCQTDAALTDEGPVIVYRNRTEDEVRDIYVVRKTTTGWSVPQPLHGDGWKIAGCPVNGPAISAREENVAVAWFTAAQEIPKVQVVFSTDRGSNFGQPLRIGGQKSLGRVDIEMIDATTAVVSWMESTEDGAMIRVVAVNADGTQGTPMTLAATQASRSSGFPIMARASERLYFAWTNADGDATYIQTAWVPLAHFKKEKNS